VPRAASNSDVYNAIAEPRRRAIIDLLARSMGENANKGRGDIRTVERPSGGHVVGTLVARLRLSQPTVSKHLRVLREVGIVSVRKRGRHRVYHLNARQLKPVHDWVMFFEQFWTNQLDRIKQRAERRAAELRSRSNQTRH
jgi:DNA-binding transcriptional ArsR family regulator